MEPNFSQGTIKINQEIFNQTMEQPLELDYQLPDYCNGIFKMLQFRTEPHINSCRHSSDQFTIDGNTIIKLIYIDEEEGNLKSITQNIPFSKTIKLDKNLNKPYALYDIKTNYSNCKIASSKKIEIKGSLTISLKIFDQIEKNILQKLDDEETTKTGIHIKKQPIKITAEQLWNIQQFKISEQVNFETPITELLDLKINLVTNDHKILLNKIISKSTAHITIIYFSTDNNSVLTKKVTIPVNQIIEMQSINENFICNFNYDISSITKNILQDGKILKIDIDGTIKSYASLSKTIEVISDVFSTKYEINPTKLEIKNLNFSETIKENLSLTENFSAINFKKIIDLNTEILNLESEQLNDSIKFNAQLKISAYGFSNDDTPEIFEKLMPISFKIKNSNENKKTIEAKINISEIEFSLEENKNLNLKIDFQINGLINNLNQIAIIDKIEINENEKKQKPNYALTIFYPQQNESVWEIAKRFSACPKNIIEENELSSEIIDDEIMLFIPVD